MEPVPLLRDVLPGNRQRWADIADSSSEQLGSPEVPRAPVISSNLSYDKLVSDDALQSRLEDAASLAEAANARSGSNHAMEAEDQCSSSASILVEALAGKNSSASSTQAATRQHLGRFSQKSAAKLRRAACDRAPTMDSLGDCLEENIAQTPPSPARRRIMRKRSHVDPASQLNGKRQRDSVPTEAAPLPEASEEDWRRREEKRQSAVLSIKALPEYIELRGSRARGEPGAEAVPGTPDPTDHTVSKRAWECRVMQWRNALKEWRAVQTQQTITATV